jgi:predicted DNA repair protein MutK
VASSLFALLDDIATMLDDVAMTKRRRRKPRACSATTSR